MVQRRPVLAFAGLVLAPSCATLDVGLLWWAWHLPRVIVAAAIVVLTRGRLGDPGRQDA